MECQVPFCDSDKGQAKWGGWNKAGRDFFKKACGLVKTSHVKQSTTKWEIECLAMLRAKHGVKEEEEKRASKKMRKLEEEVEESEDENDEFAQGSDSGGE